MVTAVMAYTHGIGMLATIEGGIPRLRPLEFSRIAGEWWAPTSRRVQQALAECDGQRVELLFVDDNASNDRIFGILECSEDPTDRRYLWELQREDIQYQYTSPEDPNLIVVKIIPGNDD